MYVYVCSRTFCNRFFFLLCALGSPWTNNYKIVAMPHCGGLVRTLHLVLPV